MLLFNLVTSIFKLLAYNCITRQKIYVKCDKETQTVRFLL